VSLTAISPTERQNMAIQTLYNTAQTREAVIRAFQGNTTPIGWVLVGQTSGYLFNPNGAPNQFGLVPNVQSVLPAIGGNALLVYGNAGIAITAGNHSKHREWAELGRLRRRPSSRRREIH
jgi:hypothetical protein